MRRWRTGWKSKVITEKENKRIKGTEWDLEVKVKGVVKPGKEKAEG